MTPVVDTPQHLMPSGRELPLAKKRRRLPRVLLVPVVLVVGLLVVLALLPEVEPDPVVADAINKSERMYALCQKVVLEYSVTPSTVTFVSSAVASAGDGWTVSGEIDEQNVFGAMVRRPYKCEMTYDETEDLFSASLVE
ncbi:hypothetical protein [Rhodococcus pyridinivorans]|uniref:hypothetical protein n=1 Tax=Rhodococcus pyridinivorans TaxID=103816 RepID=UPI0020C783C5|nr:hypothetical protein [Rhodococcus pyridinivorans]